MMLGAMASCGSSCALAAQKMGASDPAGWDGIHNLVDQSWDADKGVHSSGQPAQGGKHCMNPAFEPVQAP
eukprot:1160690-Pelagomonas_calceolata.AAC.12